MLFLFVFVSTFITAFTQNSASNWISGSDLINQRGSYGIQGIASSSNIPGGRRSVASWKAPNNNLWLFGGAGFDTTGNFGFLNDLWKFDGAYWVWISGSNLTNQNGNYGTQGIPDSLNIPGARYSAISWMDSNNNLWLFGGYGNAAGSAGKSVISNNTYKINEGYLNDLWKFDGIDWIWISGSNSTNQNGNYGTQGILDSLNIPGARVSAVSWIDSNNTFWLFGGYGYYATGSFGFLNDLWKFDGINWTWISGSNSTNQIGTYGTQLILSSSNVPGGRQSPVSWIDSNNTLWLFGGLGYDVAGSTGNLNDLWKFDGVNWTWISGSNLTDQRGTYGTKGIASSSNIPGGRDSAVSWIDSNNTLWLFGGFSTVSGYFNDLWKYDGVNWIWISGSNLRNQNGNYGTKGIPDSLNIPGARNAAVSWKDSNNTFWLFGGFGFDATGSFGYLNDLWKFIIVNSPSTTNRLTTSPVTTASLTSGELTSSPFTSSGIATSPSTSGDSRTQTVIASIVAILVILIAAGIVAFVFFTKRRSKRMSINSKSTSNDISLAEAESEKTEYQPVPAQKSLLGEIPIKETVLGVADQSAVSFRSSLDPNLSIEYSELEMGNKVGSGASGEVYAAIWRGTKVAVKVLKEVSKSDFEDFEYEAKIMTKLRPHPNVVTFLGICLEPLCIVVVFCKGGSLLSLLRSNQPLSEDVVEEIIRGIGAGMLHLHTEKIIHRDLASRNVLLGESNEPKVSDFGLARIATKKEDQSQTHSQNGPLKHMAPECLTARQYSEKSDVWAFGVTLYEIFERTNPYPNLSPVEVAIAVSQTLNPLRLTAPIKMSDEMKQLFNSLFATNPNDRPNFESIMKQLNGMDSFYL